MRTLKLTIAYDGTNYVGWQRQVNGPSVQQMIEEALQPFCAPGVPVPSVMGASRTDAGVHALGQVASVRVPFETPVDAIHRALNIRLPPDVRVLHVSDAPPQFHARFDSQGKRYRYRIFTGPVLPPFDRWFAWHLPYPSDVDAIRRAAGALVGTHDFTSFEARGTETLDAIRTIDRVEIVATSSEIQVVVEGNGFLRHMVRIIVGSLVDVGAGRQSVEWIARVLERRDRQAAGPTAPPLGLVLEHVYY
jgi:tRNA pseudouridine38-40 synthase